MLEFAALIAVATGAMVVVVLLVAAFSAVMLALRFLLLPLKLLAWAIALPLLLIKGALGALGALLGMALWVVGVVVFAVLMFVPVIPLLLLGLVGWALITLVRRPTPVRSV